MKSDKYRRDQQCLISKILVNITKTKNKISIIIIIVVFQVNAKIPKAIKTIQSI